MTDRRRVEYTSDLDSRGFESGSRRMVDRFRQMGNALTENGVVGFGQLSQLMGYSVRDFIDLGQRVGQFVVDATQAGQAVQVVAESFDKIFGPAADDLRDSLDETRRSMGLSRSEMESMVLPMGQMATNAGFAGDKAGELSGKLLTMAGDVAAFNPLVGDATQALGAMQAALRGEFDPLERFGSKLTAARVKAEAARLRGLDPMNEALSQQQLEIMAVVNLLEQDFAPALGTLADQEGSATDSVNELSAAWKDQRDQGYSLLNQTLSPLLRTTADYTEEVDETTRSQGAFQAAAETAGDALKFVFGGALASGIGLLRDTEEQIYHTSDGIQRLEGYLVALDQKIQEMPTAKELTYTVYVDPTLNEQKWEYIKGRFAEIGGLLPPGFEDIVDIGWVAEVVGDQHRIKDQEFWRPEHSDTDHRSGRVGTAF